MRAERHVMMSILLTAVLVLLLFFATASNSGEKKDTGKTEEPVILYETSTYTDEEIAEAVARYEKTAPELIDVTHSPEPLEEETLPDFHLYSDGVWRCEKNADAGTGPAVIMVVGDLMCQDGQQKAAYDGKTYDFRGSFSMVRNVFAEADLVMGNLETTTVDVAPYRIDQAQLSGKPYCNGPSTFLDALQYAGIDVLVNANNHDLDCGVFGVLTTLREMDERGIPHTGTFGSPDEPRYLIAEVKGIKIAILSYATYFNENETNLSSRGRKTLLNRYSKNRVKRDVSAAKNDGAEYIIAWNHWGLENTNNITDGQLRRAQEMADAGCDYIIGSHPHALQPYDVLTAGDGRQVPVIYSMGNFVSSMEGDINNDTIILRIELKRDRSGAVVLTGDSYIPCRITSQLEGTPYYITPLLGWYQQGLAPDDGPASLARIVEAMGEKIDCAM